MPLTSLTLSTSGNWTLEATNPGTAPPTVYGPDTIQVLYGQINLTDWPQLYLDFITLASGASVTITLASLTNRVGETFTPTAALFVQAVPAANVWTIGPAVSDGCELFGVSTPLPIQPVVGLTYPYQPSGSGVAISGTTNQITITNTGATTDTMQLAIGCAT